MTDSPRLTRTLLGLYGGGDALLDFNFRSFLRLSGIAALPRDARILDCGCASGNFLALLQGRGFTNLVGLDAAAEMAQAARERTGLEIVCRDALDLDGALPPGSCDAVVALNLQHHLGREPEWERFTAACGRVLRPGGALFVREPYLTPSFRLLWWCSFRPFFFRIPPLRRRLDSLVDERELLAYFLRHWPAHYAACLARHGFSIRRERSWLGHRIVAAVRTATDRGGER
ncbi:MAG TPA: class I SAM-dependent methyltransferase [Candidatus Methanoperedens sp.]|nr:class I SAM-dependent methyltransferase [Candidatus Methanoperedens sp.]